MQGFVAVCKNSSLEIFGEQECLYDATVWITRFRSYHSSSYWTGRTFRLYYFSLVFQAD